MTHRMERRCRPNTLEASTEYILVMEVSAGMKWALEYFYAACRAGS